VYRRYSTVACEEERLSTATSLRQWELPAPSTWLAAAIQWLKFKGTLPLVWLTVKI
jgi:hypothetical protein